jgi:hypothetical protein
MENNLTMHFITVVILVIMVFSVISIPYLVGLLLDKILKISRTESRNHIITWVFGVMIFIVIGFIAFILLFVRNIIHLLH